MYNREVAFIRTRSAARDDTEVGLYETEITSRRFSQRETMKRVVYIVYFSTVPDSVRSEDHFCKCIA